MKNHKKTQADIDIPPEIEAIAAEGINLFSRLINVASKSQDDRRPLPKPSYKEHPELIGK